MGAFSEAPVGRNDGAVQGLVTLLQLGRRAREATRLEELGFVIVNETRSLLAYRQAALWLEGDSRRVTALSGVPVVDPGAPYVQWLRRLFKAVTPVAQPMRVDRETLPALVAEEWPQWLPPHALCIPLHHARLAAPGLLLLARELPWQDAEVALSGEIAPVFGHALFGLRSGDSTWHRFRQALRMRRSGWWLAVLVLLVGIIPVHLSVLAEAEVTPVQPFVVRAPLDGVIDHLSVRPNQSVAAGKPLFSLDATTLRGQYDSASKAYDAARQQYRQSAQQAVTEDKSRAELATRRGEMALKAVDLQYAAEQLSRVDVKAERSGVAVFDDVNDWTGKAVSVGEKVLMLADPDKVELTAFMPAGDQLALKPGARVVFYPNAAPFSSTEATLLTQAYRAAPTDQGVLAYRIKARFSGDKSLPRLGLSGTARLYGERVPLIYYVLRRPLATLRQWLGW